MADDINVVFGADTSQLDAAVSKVKTEMQSLVPGAAGSGILTPLPAGLGGPSQTPLLDAATAAAKRNTGAKRELIGATNELSQAEENFGRASTRAGIDFGAMGERMAGRLVILEAVRLAIQGVKYVIDQVSNLQQAKIQFDTLSSSTGELTANFQSLKYAWEHALIDPGKAVQVTATLEDFGINERKAILLTQDLGQWSHRLGVDADKLAEALGRVRQGEGSLQDMRLVTHMMGDQSTAGRQLIQTYVDATKALKNFEMENATAEKSIEAVIRATERMGEKVERSRSRGQEFLKETGNLEDIQAQLPKLVARPELAGLSIETLIGSGALRLPQMSPQTSQIVRNQVKDYISEYRKGLAQVQQEEGLSPEAMRKLAPTLSTDYIMGKAKEAHQDEMRNIREEDEARRAGIERQKTARETEIAGARAEFAKVGPEAVTGPSAAQWQEVLSSLKGQGALTQTQFNAGIAQVVTELKNVQTASNGTTTAVGGLENLFRSG